MRLLPLILGYKVQDPKDNVWQLVLQLKYIVDLICAQQISEAQVAYLDVLIQEYLEIRKALFPDINLRPKTPLFAALSSTDPEIWPTNQGMDSVF